MSSIRMHAMSEAARTAATGRVEEPAPDPQRPRLIWRPPAEWTALEPAPPPETIESIRRVFGGLPAVLDEQTHLPVLRALAVVGGAHYGRLAKLLEERGTIEVAIEGDEP